MRGARTAGILFMVLGLSGCLVGPDYRAPVLVLPESYRTDFAPETESPSLWWSGFEDETLDTLVADALANNLEIGVAVARLAQAAAQARAAKSDLFPIIDGTADGTVRSGSADADAGGAMSFTPDIFGRTRRSIEQARALAEAEGYTLVDVRRVIVASVVGAYVELRRTQARLKLLETSLDLQRQTLDIVRLRRQAGLSSDLDVQRATADLARTRSQRGTLTAARDRAENNLAVLLGIPPKNDLVPDETEPAIPTFASGPPVGIPSSLLRQRPDVLAAEKDLVAAVAAIGIEVADLYPSLRLPGQVTASLGGAQSMVGDVSAQLSAALDIPLFDAGRRRAEVKVARRRAQAARLSYEQTVLQSLSEVENALAAIEGDKERRDELLKAIEASEQAFNQLNALYKEGLASFIDILDAQRTLITSREAYIEAEADLTNSIIDLYSALGAPVAVGDS